MTKTFGLLTLLVITVMLAGCVSTGIHSSEPGSATRLNVEHFEAQMKHAMQQYLDGFNQGNTDKLISLFAEDARIEDPVGGGRIVEGKEAITAFYQRAVELVERLDLDAPIRSSYGRSAAMAFTIHLKIHLFLQNEFRIL